MRLLRKLVVLSERILKFARPRSASHPSSHRPSSAPFLSGDTFRDESDGRFGDGEGLVWKSRETGRETVFCAGDSVHEFVRFVLPRFKRDISLVVGNSDRNYDKRDSYLCTKGLKSVFVQNLAEPIASHVFPLPIGLENLHYHTNGETAHFVQLRLRSEYKAPKILVGFNVDTNPNERIPALEWARLSDTCTEISKIGPLDFREALAAHMFALSPPGNGLDCHRTWESLYLRTVPIVKRSYAMEYFSRLGLPLFIVDDWKELSSLTPEQLVEIYQSKRPGFENEWLWSPRWLRMIRNGK